MDRRSIANRKTWILAVSTSSRRLNMGCYKCGPPSPHSNTEADLQMVENPASV